MPTVSYRSCTWRKLSCYSDFTHIPQLKLIASGPCLMMLFGNLSYNPPMTWPIWRVQQGRLRAFFVRSPPLWMSHELPYRATVQPIIRGCFPWVWVFFLGRAGYWWTSPTFFSMPNNYAIREKLTIDSFDSRARCKVLRRWTVTIFLVVWSSFFIILNL